MLDSLIKRPRIKADSHGDLYAPKSIFSRNTANKIHGRRQPCRGFFNRLAEKYFSLEYFAVLNIRFFLAATPLSAEIFCVFQDQRRKLRGKRFIQNRVNPYVRPPKARPFLFLQFKKHNSANHKTEPQKFCPAEDKLFAAHKTEIINYRGNKQLGNQND